MKNPEIPKGIPMAALTTGEVEKLTGVKSHVLRYWEENIPFLSPQKDSFGRRLYSSRDVQIILRLKHLIQEKKYTVEGAQEQLVFEATNSDNANMVKEINMLKNELIDIYRIIQAQKGED